jgi:hypothetical protein
MKEDENGRVAVAVDMFDLSPRQDHSLAASLCTFHLDEKSLAITLTRVVVRFELGSI